MQDNEINKLAHNVVDQLSLKGVDAMRVLLAAVDIVLSNLSASGESITAPSEVAVNVLQRRVNGGCKISRDPEVEQFISSIPRYLPLIQLRSMLVARFGKERVPSKSSLHRYITKVAPSGATRAKRQNKSAALVQPEEI